MAAVLGVACASLVLTGCGDGNEGPAPGSTAKSPGSQPAWPGAEIERWVGDGIEGVRLEERSERSGKTRFTQLEPSETGLGFISEVEVYHKYAYLYRSGLACGGLAIGDVDADGRPMCIFAEGPGPTDFTANWRAVTEFDLKISPAVLARSMGQKDGGVV